MQFYLEATPETVRFLTEHCREELVREFFIQSEREILSTGEHYANLHSVMGEIAEGFFK